jgi:hydrogenase nickel incorporation protein HypB
VLTNLQDSRSGSLNHGHHHDEHDHSHPHEHEHEHEHHTHSHDADSHGSSHRSVIHLEQEVLAKNNRLAERNRGWLVGRNILALNLVSAPGSGKTALLERTVRDLGSDGALYVIEGDQATDRDAQRIHAAGGKVVQINTGSGCHLDAAMVGRALQELNPPPNSVVFIENVGNLVCPALFDLGECAKVAIVSVTEGEDKPIKYPHMFRASDLMVLNKIDLLPHVSFDVARCLDYARQVNHHLQVLQLSATQGQGLEAWYEWVRTQRSRPQHLSLA